MKLQHPIVLVHGLGATSRFPFMDYFQGLARHLRRGGHRVVLANLSPWQTIEHRAAQLREQLEREIPKGRQRRGHRFNLVAHSLGGLDSRYLISALDYGDRITSLTTIGTTHRGTHLADLVQTRPLPHVLRAIDRLLAPFGATAKALAQVTTRFCRGELAARTPNHRDVAYFSAITVIGRPIIKNSLPVFWLPHNLLHRAEGDNDGFVSAQSAAWGEVICRDYGDHYAQIGQFGRVRTGRHDHLPLYDRIVKRLVRAGF